MKFCKYCGSQIPEDQAVCPYCHKELSSQKAPVPTQNQPAPAGQLATDITSWLKKPAVWICIAVLLVVIVLIVTGGKCDYGSCKNQAISGHKYCYTHKCAVSDCKDSCLSYSNFCYTHHLLYDEDTQISTTYVPSYQLKISNVSVYSKYNYTYAEGTVTNNSDSTVSFLKIKGSFTDYQGNVIDTDWTYAVGSEGLAPGESCKWKLSVEKDYSIDDCEISILDYDY